MFDENQRTPLMAACENNHLDTVKYLLRAGASVRHKVGHCQDIYLPCCQNVLLSTSLTLMFCLSTASILACWLLLQALIILEVMLWGLFKLLHREMTQ